MLWVSTGVWGRKGVFFCMILSQSLPCALSSFLNALKTFLMDLNIQMHIYFSHKWTKEECINFPGLLYKVPHTWWLNTIESCSLTVLESEVWNQGTGRAISLWKLWGRILCLFHLLVTPGIPWLVQHHSSLCIHLHVAFSLSASLSQILLYPSLLWTPFIGLKIHPKFWKTSSWDP